MAQKKKPAGKCPTEAQAEAMKRNGIHYPFLWTVIGEYGHQFMVKHTIYGDVKLIDPSGK